MPAFILSARVGLALAGGLAAHFFPELVHVRLARSAWCWHSDGAGGAVPLSSSPVQDKNDAYFTSFLNGCCQEGSSDSPDYYCYSASQCKNGAPSSEDALQGISGRRQSCTELTQTGSNGMLGDYCPVSDVTQHARVSLDVAAMTSELNRDPPDFAAAKAIYTNGENSQTSSGLRTVQSMAERDLTGEPFFDTFSAFYGGAMYQKDFLMAAFDGTGNFTGASNMFRSVVLKKGLLAVGLMYAAHELESAKSKGAQGLTTDDGAPHAWDESWAFYYGVDGTSSAHEVSKKRDKDFSGVDVAPALVPLFNQGQHALRAVTYDAASAQAAATAIYNVVAITYLRAALKYSYKMQMAYSEEYHAEAYTYWRTIAGWVANASLAPAAVIENAVKPMTQAEVAGDVHCIVKTAVEAIAQEMGYNCSSIGMWYTAEELATAGCGACSFTGMAAEFSSGRAEVANTCSDPSAPSPMASPMTSATTDVDGTIRWLLPLALVALLATLGVVA